MTDDPHSEALAALAELARRLARALRGQCGYET